MHDPAQVLCSQRQTVSRALLGACALLAAFGCSCADTATGRLRVTASGEDAALSGYPVGSGEDSVGFADGWELQFDKVLVSIAGFRLRAADGDDAAVHAEPVVADLHLGKPTLWSFEDVPARRWDRVSFRYAPLAADAEPANAIDEEDLQRMRDNDYSLYIAATARKDEQEVALEYGFSFTVELSGCVDAADETDGVVIANGELNQAEITVHLDHLFFDSFVSDDAELRFDPMAAVAPKSGPLTLADLARQKNLSDLKDRDGEPLGLTYDPGSGLKPTPQNLEEYVVAAAATTGHFNGEGHCHYERR